MGLGVAKHEKDPFDDFLDSLKQPRQVMESLGDDIIPQEELPETAAADDEPLGQQEPPESVADQRRRYSLSMIPAETLVNCVDLAFTQVNSIIAKQKVEGASDEEKDSLIQAAASYMKEKEIDISPGSMLVVMVLLIYGPKVYQAVELRRANEENERLRLELEKQKSKVRELKRRHAKDDDTEEKEAEDE